MKNLELRIPPPIIALLVMAGMYLIDRLLPLGVRVPGRVFWFIGFFVLGMAVAIVGVVQFRQQRTTIHPLNPEHSTSLVTSGIYRYSRNPMYLGMLLVIVGWLIYLGSWLAVFMPVVFVLLINKLQIVPEERILASKFGQSFTEYLGSVRRWI